MPLEKRIDYQFPRLESSVLLAQTLIFFEDFNRKLTIQRTEHSQTDTTGPVLPPVDNSELRIKSKFLLIQRKRAVL